MAKPPPSPGDLRSPRKRALEIGTDPARFHTDLPQDHAGGFPIGTPGQGGSSRESVTGAPPPPSSPDPKPFK